MYKKIINPETGRAVNVKGRIGKNVLRKYISNNNLKGGAGGFFDFLLPTPSNPMDEVNNIMTRITEAMQLVQAKQGEWRSLNIDQSTRESELDLLQKDLMKLQKYAQKIKDRPEELRIREKQKEQSRTELDACNKQLLESELRCKSLEKTKIDTDTEYQNWFQASSAKVAETLPQIDDIIDRITATDMRLKEESERAIELGKTSMDSEGRIRGELTGMRSSPGYGSSYGSLQQDWRNPLDGGGKKNNKKTKKSTKKNNKKNHKRK